MNPSRLIIRFHLKNQAAQDLGRYDFIKDVQRLEQIIGRQPDGVGLAVMLTNDSSYWKAPRLKTIDAAFRLHEGRELHGALSWDEGASPGTTHGRTAPLVLGGHYHLAWNPYSNVAQQSKGEFRYLALEIRA